MKRNLQKETRQRSRLTEKPKSRPNWTSRYKPLSSTQGSKDLTMMKSKKSLTNFLRTTRPTKNSNACRTK